MKLLGLLAGLLMFVGQAGAQATRVVSGSTLFSIKYWAGTCEGKFGPINGTAQFDPAKPEATVIDVYVTANTIDTDNNMRDKDVKGDKYLNVAAHPQVRFRSTSVTEKDGTYYAKGTMTIKGVAKPMTIPFKARKNADGGYAISSNFTLNRLDYGVGKSTATLKDNVSLSITATIK